MNPRITEIVSRLFPESDRAAALTLLSTRCGSTLPMMTHANEDSFDRIRVATLRLSRGSLAALEREIEGAHCDWRDTLVSAGFADDVDAHLHWMPS